jgi:hypothetical protein
MADELLHDRQFDTLQLLVNRSQRNAKLRLHFLVTGVHAGMLAEHDRRDQLRQAGEQQRAIILLLGVLVEQSIHMTRIEHSPQHQLGNGGYRACGRKSAEQGISEK